MSKGYQPEKELTSNAPKGGSGVPDKTNQMENLTVEQIKKLLIDFSQWECTEEYWKRDGKAQATNQINHYVKHLRATGKIA